MKTKSLRCDPDVARDLWTVGARLADLRAAPEPLQMLLIAQPLAAQAPSQLLPGRYLSWLWLYSVAVSGK